MAFSLGGFSAAAGPCGCCSPPCLWSLCVSVTAPCAAGVTLTARYQGPDGIDVTRTITVDAFGRAQDCYADPPAGPWTITISHPCLRTWTRTVAVVQCGSQTLHAPLELPFAALFYSDDHGAVSWPYGPTGACTWMGSYTYTSVGHAAANVPCGYGWVGAAGQTNDVLVYVRITLRVTDSGLIWTIGRRVPIIPVRRSCLDPTWINSPFGSDVIGLGLSNCHLVSSAEVTSPCLGEELVDVSGVLSCDGIQVMTDPSLHNCTMVTTDVDDAECPVSFTLTGGA